MRVKQHGQLELARARRRSRRRTQRTSGSAKTMPEHARATPVTTISALMTLLPRRHAAGLPPVRQLSRERRHERGAHRAFGKQVAQQVGDAERDDEGVHRVAGAEERRRAPVRGPGRGCGWSWWPRRRTRPSAPSAVGRARASSGAKLAADGFVDGAPVGILAGEPRHHGLHHLAHVLREVAPVSAIAAATAASISSADAAGGRYVLEDRDLARLLVDQIVAAGLARTARSSRAAA